MMENIIRWLRKINCFIKISEEKFCILLIIPMVIITGISIFSRYVLSKPLGWANEYVMFFYFWISFIGASLVQKEENHYKIIGFERVLPSKIRIINKIFNDLLAITFLIFLVYASIRLLPSHSLRPMTLSIKKSWHTLALVIGFSFMVLSLIQNILERFSKIKKATIK